MDSHNVIELASTRKFSPRYRSAALCINHDDQSWVPGETPSNCKPGTSEVPVTVYVLARIAGSVKSTFFRPQISVAADRARDQLG